MISEGVPELPYVLWSAAKVVRIVLHLVYRGTSLEQFVDLPVGGEPFLVEPSVAHRGTDNHGTGFERSSITHYRRADILQHYDGVGSHPGPVVKRTRHAEHQDIGLLSLQPGLHPFGRRGPTRLLHLSGIAGEHPKLPTSPVEDGVDGEEGSLHRPFDLLAYLGELLTEVAVAGGGHEVPAVQGVGGVVATDRTPGGKARGGRLVPAGVTAVGVAHNVAEYDREVRLYDVAVDLHQVAVVRLAQFDDAFGIFGVLVDQPLSPEA